jgi:beta-galactosidase GanA
MFRQWAEQKHGSIETANKAWDTSYRGFDSGVAPPVKNSWPLPGTNRALWYDWARFNQDRFTGYLLWVREEIQKLDDSMPLAAGGSSSMLADRTGTTEIDEERIVNEVDDVIIH